ncbi:MAG: hypothetical protein GXP59_02590 [Deltaproteobacteria bacterium]|nr:hypothetical protein [Deltaproteobacteria bacterium]
MSRRIVIFSLLTLAVSAAALVLSSQKPHQFSADQCLICHTDAKGGDDDLRSDITEACATCHPTLRNYQAHPTDIIPRIPIPADMLLINGRLTCITCHDVHDKSEHHRNFLRRGVSGKPFCLICHDVDAEGHLFIGTTHNGNYKVSDPTSQIDSTTLLCLECHSDRIDALDKGLGAGTWSHSDGRSEHPVGVSYEEAYRKHPRAYVPPGMLNKGLELYDGKIGCGTCHNPYTGKKNMLTVGNKHSTLCFACHIT